MIRVFKAGGVLSILIALCGVSVMGTVAKENRAEPIFEARCSTCHDTSRPLSKTKTADEWRQTVTRMQGYAGGKISDEDRETIIEYLAGIRGK
jgi:hypothetical protein